MILEPLKIVNAEHARQIACCIASGKMSDCIGQTPLGEETSIKLGTGENGSNIICLQAGDDIVKFSIRDGNGFKSDPLFQDFTRRHYQG